MRNSLQQRVRKGLGFIAAARGRDRSRLAIYLAANLMSRLFGLSFASREMTLTLEPGIRVSVEGFASQLGSYSDIFGERVYGQLPQFVAQPGQVIVDAGAHVGFYSLWQGARVGSTGRIYAFEPNPVVHALLVKNVGQNGLPWVKCIPRALFAQEQTLVMRVRPRGSSSTRVLYSEPGRDVQTIEVQGTTLDAFVAHNRVTHIDILKLDVEGAEVDVVRGGLQRALSITDKIVMESHAVRSTRVRGRRTWEPVRDILVPLGFRMSLHDRARRIVYFEREC